MRRRYRSCGCLGAVRGGPCESEHQRIFGLKQLLAETTDRHFQKVIAQRIKLAEERLRECERTVWARR